MAAKESKKKVAELGGGIQRKLKVKVDLQILKVKI